MWKLTTNPEDAPEVPERLEITWQKGLPTKVVVLGPEAKTVEDPVEIFLTLNALARKHGVGRIDIVENRFIGVKSRGCYESPGATILRVAHMDLEGLTLDRNVRALRDQFVTVQLSNILYNGYFFSPEREFVMSAIPASQRTVNGTTRLALYKGNTIVEGRYSDTEKLYDQELASMDDVRLFSRLLTEFPFFARSDIALCPPYPYHRSETSSPRRRPALSRLSRSGSRPGRR